MTRNIISNKADLLYLVEDPRFIICDCIVLDCLVGKLRLQAVDHLDGVEVDGYSTFGSAGDICDLVGLQSYLHFFVGSDDGPFDVPTGLGCSLHNSASPPVQPNVTFRN